MASSRIPQERQMEFFAEETPVSANAREATDAMAEMRAAVAKLNAAADAYYGGRGELMSDYEWDALFDRVKALEEETGIVLADSPTNKVSSDQLAGRKEPHEFAALSLAKTKRVEEVAKWAQGRPIWLSWKLDGLTLVVTYDGGRLAKVVTRGDGHVGTNITHLADGIAGIPRAVADRGHLVVRGEAVISYADFADFTATSGDDFANPRNLASGSLALKDVEELKRRRLQWIPFTLVHAERELSGWGERMEYLRSVGLEPVASERIDEPSVGNIRAAIGRWSDEVASRRNPFPVDGLVVVYDDTRYAATGSVTGHHATRAGLAFKWQDEVAETELERIEWSCALASITPVAVFAPVSLEGTLVRRASLCNVSECERLGIGGPGTKLHVIKANKIIPKVVEVVASEGRFTIPCECPACGAPTQTRLSPSGTKTLRCTNDECPAKMLAKFERFVSKEGLDIEGLAGETLAKFVNNGWIRSMADILCLSEHRDEIAAMEGFGPVSAGKICDTVDACREREAARILVALSIPLCGSDVARRLTSGRRLREVFDAAFAAEDDNLFAAIEGIGPAKSAAFVAWCRDPRHRELVDRLLSRLTVIESSAPTGGRCQGLVFVITGDVQRFANRAAFKAYVEAQGGKLAGSVSTKTNFLVNNDVDSSSGKNIKAKALGVPIISEDEFIARFKGV